jgi:hypothetical protein
VYPQVDRASPAIGPEADQLFLKFFMLFVRYGSGMSLHASSIHPPVIQSRLIDLEV